MNISYRGHSSPDQNQKQNIWYWLYLQSWNKCYIQGTIVLIIGFKMSSKYSMFKVTFVNSKYLVRFQNQKPMDTKKHM